MWLNTLSANTAVQCQLLKTNIVPPIQITVPSSRTALSSQINNCTNPTPHPRTFLCIDPSDGDIGNMSGSTPEIQRKLPVCCCCCCYYCYYYYASKIRRQIRKIRDMTRQSNKARPPCITLQLVSADNTKNTKKRQRPFHQQHDTAGTRNIRMVLNRISVFCDATLPAG